MNTFKKVICLISSFVLMISLGILIANNIVENKEDKTEKKEIGKIRKKSLCNNLHCNIRTFDSQ